MSEGPPPPDRDEPVEPSSILSADPVLRDEPGGPPHPPPPGPEVRWGLPPAPSGIPVPGSPGFLIGGVAARFAAWWIDNVLLAVLAFVGSIVLSGLLQLDTVGDARSLGILYWLLYVGLSALYFVLLWTSGGRATLGMRALNLQIGTAFDGRPLSLAAALLRWALLGYVFLVLLLIPATAAVGSVLWLIWPIVLLVSTATSPTRQGIHDRAAASAIVRPIGGTSSGLAIACVVTLVILVVIGLASVLALIYLGGEAARILEEVGRSV